MDYAPPIDVQADQPAIVVTASRLPEQIEDSAASVSIVDDILLDHRGDPAITT